MTLQTGHVGTFIVGSDHVGWLGTFSKLRFNLINTALLNNIISGNVQNPKVRVYIQDAPTGIETEIGELITFCNAEMNKDDYRGRFRGTVRPEKVTNEFTTLYLDKITPTLLQYFVVKAGYIWQGTEMLIPIIKGVMKGRNPSYGLTGAINIDGWDFSERLNLITGTWSGDTYTTAKTLMIALLNAQGLVNYDFTGFTDFSITGVKFHNNTGLEVVQLLARYKGLTTWFFNGSGTFICRDTPTDSNVKYDYSNTSRQNLTFNISSRKVVSEVNVVGNTTNATLTRRTNSTDLAKYGRLIEPLQNKLLNTATEAETAADLIINQSRKFDCQLTVSFNPYLYIDDIISLTHEELVTATYTDGQQSFRVIGYNHYFDGQTAKTNLHLESVDYDAPNIGTV